MCGFFGCLYANTNAKPDEERVRLSAARIGHRGPDNLTVQVGYGFGLAHARLSLIDIQERSNQPMWDATGRYCLLYNGEIYNYRELRSELKASGAHFQTSGDTEVILWGLILHGESFLLRLQGMFALAFYDSERREGLLARDRFGIKPLFFASQSGRILFASEIKALQPWLDTTPDPATSMAYLAGVLAPTAPSTFFAGIRSLEPGTYIRISRDISTFTGSFFSTADFFDASEHERLSREKANSVIDEAQALLEQSIARHLTADLPVGALCSGGIDSALILRMATRHNPALRIFHANVLGATSEYDAARELAKALNLEMKSVDVSPSEFVERIPEVMWHTEKPFTYHPNSVPFLEVSKLANSESVKAVLTGEGADESFLGYSHLPLIGVIRRLRRLFIALNRRILTAPYIGRWLDVLFLDEYSSLQLLGNRMEIQDELANITDSFKNVRDPGVAETVSLLGYHLRTLLDRNDRLGMAAHLEARFPFLDNDLVRFSINLPYQYKIRKGTRLGSDKKHPLIGNKWIIRKVAERCLPASIATRPKRGFPTNFYEKNELDSRFLRGSFFQDFFELSNRQTERYWTLIDRQTKWRTVHFSIWGELFVKGRHIDELSKNISQCTKGTARQ